MAFTFASDQERVEALYIGYFGRAGEPGGVQYWVDQLEAGRTFAQVAAAFSVQDEATSTHPFLANPDLVNPEDFVTSLYNNLLEREPDAAGFAYWVGQAEAAQDNPFLVGLLVAQFISGATNSAAGQDIDTLQNKIDAAEYFTNELAAAGIRGTDANGQVTPEVDAAATAAIEDVSSDDETVEASQDITDDFVAGGGGVDSNILLTAGLDDLTGTSQADTFIGDEETYSSGDMLNGAGGNDTFRLFVNTTAEDSNFDDGDDATMRFTSIENIEVEVDNAPVAGLTFDLGSATGVRSIASVGSDSTVSYEEVQNNVDIRLEDTTADLNVTFDANALSGDQNDDEDIEGSEIDVSVENVGSEADFSTITLATDGDDDIGMIRISATGSDESYLNMSYDGEVEVLEIAGASRLVLDNAGANNIVDDLEEIDGTANTGGIAINLTTNTENVDFTGGSGNDFVVFGANGDFDDDTAGDMVDGGAGDDVLVLNTTTADDIEEGKITNFEHLGLIAGGAGGETISLDDGGFDDAVLLDGLTVGFEDFDGGTLFLGSDALSTVTFESADEISIQVGRPEAVEEVPDGFGGITSDDSVDAVLVLDLSGGAGTSSVDTVNIDTGDSSESLESAITLGEDTDSLIFTGAGDIYFSVTDSVATDENLELLDFSGFNGNINMFNGDTGDQTFIIGNLTNTADASNPQPLYDFDDDGAADDNGSQIDLGSDADANQGDDDSDVVEFLATFNDNLAILNFNANEGAESNDFLDFTAMNISVGDINIESVNGGTDTLVTFDGMTGRILLVGVAGLDGGDFFV